MTLPALATVDDLERRLGQTIPDRDQAEALLERASSKIRSYVGLTWVDPDTGLLDGVPEYPDVRGICVEMVVRAVTNPFGVTQDTTGPFSVSYGPDAAQRVFLQRGEKEELAPIRRRGGLGVISTTRGPIETATVLVPTTDPLADPVPFYADPWY